MWDRLRRRPLTVYFLYRSLALTWAFMPFQVYYLQRKGLSVADVFDLNVVFCIAAVGFEVPTGMLADRHGRRMAMAAGGFVMSLACGLFIVGHGFWTYALAEALAALSMALASGADSAYLYDHLANNRQTSTYARLEGWSTAAKGIGNLVAVILGALIYQYVLPEGVFVFTALITGAAGVLALWLPERRTLTEGHVQDHLKRALRILSNDGRLISLVVFGALSFVLLRLSLFADQPHLEAHLTEGWVSRTVLTMGLLAALKEIGSASVAGASGWIFARVRARTIAVSLAGGLVLSYWLMGEDRGGVCTVIMVVMASAFGLFSPLMRALMNRLIPGSRDRATLLSMEGMGRRILFAAASPIFGRAVEGSSLHATFTGTAWVAFIGYIVLGVSALAVFRVVLPASGGRRTATSLASVTGL